jgi:hypothetical protein
MAINQRCGKRRNKKHKSSKKITNKKIKIGGKVWLNARNEAFGCGIKNRAS